MGFGKFKLELIVIGCVLHSNKHLKCFSLNAPDHVAEEKDRATLQNMQDVLVRVPGVARFSDQ